MRANQKIRNPPNYDKRFQIKKGMHYLWSNDDNSDENSSNTLFGHILSEKIGSLSLVLANKKAELNKFLYILMLILLVFSFITGLNNRAYAVGLGGACSYDAMCSPYVCDDEPTYGRGLGSPGDQMVCYQLTNCPGTSTPNCGDVYTNPIYGCQANGATSATECDDYLPYSCLTDSYCTDICAIKTLTAPSSLLVKINYSYEANTQIGGLNLTWSDNSDGETKFYISRAANNGTYSNIANATSKSNYSDNNIADNTLYSYKISSIVDGSTANCTGTFTNVVSNITADRTAPKREKLSIYPREVILMYDFEQNSSIIASDQSSSWNDGYSSSHIVWSNAGGVKGGGISLDGYNSDGADYIVVNATAGLPSGNVPKTIEAWVILRGICNSNYCNIGGFGTTTAGQNFQIGSGYSGNLTVWGWGSSYDWDTKVPAIGIMDDNWHYIVVTYNGSTTFLYIDGRLNASNSTKTWSTNPQKIVIGNEIDQAGQEFNGSIDNFKIYDRALTAAEISLNYNNSISDITNNYVDLSWSAGDRDMRLYLSFEDESGSTTKDRSVNKNSGDLINSPTRTTDGRYGSAVEFSANSVQYINISKPRGLPSGNVQKSMLVWANFNTSCISSWCNIGGFGTNAAGQNFQIGTSANSGTIYIWGWANDWSTGYPTSLITNSWHHLAVTYDGNMTTFFVDGIKSSNVSNYSWSTNPQKVVIGNEIDEAGMAFNGSIDEFKIFNRSLTQGEIINDMQSGLIKFGLFRSYSGSGPWEQIGSGNITDTNYSDNSASDMHPPEEVTDLNSTSHTINVWSSDNTVDFNWTQALDHNYYWYKIASYDVSGNSNVSNPQNASVSNVSGLFGYDVGCNQTSADLESQSVDLGWAEINYTCTFPDGYLNYFHIKSVDNASNWGLTSADSGPYWIDATGPSSCNVSSINESSPYSYISGTTIFYNSAETGFFTVNVSAIDAASGISNVSFPVTVSAGATDTDYQFMYTYDWDTGDTFNTSATIVCGDNASNTNSTLFTVRRDIAPPANGFITYENGYIYLSAEVSFSEGTDLDAGINTSRSRLLRKNATLSEGACGSYGNWSQIGPYAPISIYSDSSVIEGQCYMYQYEVFDNVYNGYNYTSASEIKIGTYPNINYNATVPSKLHYDTYMGALSVYVTVNVTDSDNNLISVNFTVVAPNGTKVINNVNTSIHTGDVWNSPSFILDQYGQWNYTASAYDSSSGQDTVYGSIKFLQITESIAPSQVAANSTTFVYGHVDDSQGADVKHEGIRLWVNSDAKPIWWDNTSLDSLTFNYRFPIIVREDSGNNQVNALVIITGADLSASTPAIDISQIDITKLAIVDHTQVPIGTETNGHAINSTFVDRDHDGVFDSGDYVKFYVNLSADTSKLLYLYDPPVNWSAVQSFDNTYPSYGAEPVVTADWKGQAHLLVPWNPSDNTNWYQGEQRHYIYNGSWSSGNTISGATWYIHWSPNIPLYADIAYDSQNNIYTVWGDPGSYVYRIGFYNATSGAWTITNINAGSYSAWDAEPAILVDENDWVHILVENNDNAGYAWSAGSINHSISRDHGKTWTSSKITGSDTTFSHYYAAASGTIPGYIRATLDPQGNIHAVWTHSDYSTTPYTYMKWTASNQSWGNIKQWGWGASYVFGAQPDVVVDSNNNVHVFHMVNTNGVYAWASGIIRDSVWNGTTWTDYDSSANTVSIYWPDNIPSFLDAEADFNGNVYAVWGDKDEYRSVRVMWNGTAKAMQGETSMASTYCDHGADLDLAVDNSGRPHFFTDFNDIVSSCTWSRQKVRHTMRDINGTWITTDIPGAEMNSYWGGAALLITGQINAYAPSYKPDIYTVWKNEQINNYETSVGITPTNINITFKETDTNLNLSMEPVTVVRSDLNYVACKGKTDYYGSFKCVVDPAYTYNVTVMNSVFKAVQAGTPMDIDIEQNISWVVYPREAIDANNFTARTDRVGNYNYSFLSPGRSGTYYVKENMTYNGEYGEQTQSFTVKYAPFMTAITLNPVSQNTSTNIQCYATIIDNDNATIIAEWAWYNSSTYKLSGTTTISNNTNSLVTTLGSGNTTRWEGWNCTVRGSDGEFYSNYVSITLNVSNEPPTHGTPYITAPGQSYYDERFNLTCNWNSSIDSDNDKVANFTIWYRNNQSILIMYTPFEDYNKTNVTKDYAMDNNGSTKFNKTIWSVGQQTGLIAPALGSGWNTYTSRQIIENTSASANMIRLKLEGPPSGAEQTKIAKAFICERSTGSTCTAGSVTQIFFNNMESVYLPLIGYNYSDWINFSVNQGTSYLISFYYNDSSNDNQIYWTEAGGTNSYYKVADVAGSESMGGGESPYAHLFAVAEIETVDSVKWNKTVGIIGGAYDFDGKGDRIVIEQDRMNYSSGKTYSMWIKNYGSKGNIFSSGPKIDLNNDGYVDLLMTSYYDTNYLSASYIYYNDKDGTFTKNATAMNNNGAFAGSAGDFDNDGDLDIVFSSYNDGDYYSSPQIFWNNGVGGFTTSSSLTPMNGSKGVGVADLDDDGDLDLVFNSYCANSACSVVLNAQAFIYWNNGTGGYPNRTEMRIDGGGSGIAIADFNNDGTQDILLTPYNDGDWSVQSRIYWNNGNRDFSQSSVLPTHAGGLWGGGGTFVDDFDYDGDFDIAMAIYYDGDETISPEIFWNNGTGNFSSTTFLASMNRQGGVTGGDIDLDGDVDLVFTNYYDGDYLAQSRIYWNNGSGNYSSYTNLPATYGQGGASLVDVDNDFDLDLIITSTYDGDYWSPYNRVYFNNGTGGFTNFDEYAEYGFLTATPIISDQINGGQSGISMPTGYGKAEMFVVNNYVYSTFSDSSGKRIRLRGNISANSWNYIALSYDEIAKQIKLYVNGDLSASSNAYFNVSYAINSVYNNITTVIGKNIGEMSYNGTIDEVMIYNRALSAEQIRQTYVAGKAGATSNFLSANETSVGDELYCKVIPNDGYIDGSVKESSHIIIRDYYPSINSFGTVPSRLYYDTYIGALAIYITADVTDYDNNLISVNYTLTAPNGTKVINNVNATTNLGNKWNTTIFKLDQYGQWNYTIYALDSDSYSTTAAGTIKFLQITESLNASIVNQNSSVTVSGHINDSQMANVVNQTFCIYLNNSPIRGLYSCSVPWWNASYNYRTNISIESNISSHLNNSIVLVNFSTISLVAQSMMRNNCGDVRFVNANNIELQYTLETSTCNSTNTIYWVWGNWTGNANTAIWAYYGNSNSALKTDYTNPDIDLVMYMHFDNSSAYGETSTKAFDFSKRGNNVTCTNCPTWNSTGKFGGAYDFDGTNDVFTLGDVEIVTGKHMSIAVWAKIDSLTEYESIVAKNAATWAYAMHGDTTAGKLRFWVDNNDYTTDAETDSNIADSNWHFFVGVYDGTLGSANTKLYVDGVVQTKTAAQTIDIPNTADTVNIGAYGAAAGPFDGMIDELRIYNRSLSSDEILAIYNSTKPYFIQNETLTKTNSTGHYTYPFTAPSEGGGYFAKINSTYGTEYGEQTQYLTVDAFPLVSSTAYIPTK
ncbi:MAG: DUF2341 domain-containing protein, partial [archaeon]